MFSQGFRTILQNSPFFNDKSIPNIDENGEYNFTSTQHIAYLFDYIMNYKYYKSKKMKKDIDFHNYFILLSATGNSL